MGIYKIPPKMKNISKYIDNEYKMIYNKDNKRDSLAVVPARVFSSYL